MKIKDQALSDFLEAWPESPEGNRAGFIRLQEFLENAQGVELSFHPRPGVTWSLRAVCPGHERPLLAMVDVIDDTPRWLSVCMFGDMVTDPEERGAEVPGGLLGEDALCFDLESCADAAALLYVEARLAEAWRTATGR